jgi:chromosomal replication initiation ATPase DnaA
MSDRPNVSQPILNRVAERYGITPVELLSKDRSAPLPEARGAVAKELKEIYKWSSTRIGRLLGIHHTTVLYGLGVCKSRKAPKWERK